MITLPVETWATLGTLLAALVALYVALRGDVHREIGRVESRIDGLDGRMDRLEVRLDRLEHRLEDRFDRLDDRVYALAAGLRPQVEAARADDA